MQYLIFILALLLPLLAFQNCQFTESFQTPYETRPTKTLNSGGGGSQGNGGGYTGKLNIIAPTQISNGHPYVVIIQGGAPPYQLSSPHGDIEIINISGNVYQLKNRFTHDVVSFDLSVRDSRGNSSVATIEIIASDNVFNYSRATAALIGNNRTVIFDEHLGMGLVFDPEGIPLNTLNPKGDQRESFESFVDLEQDSKANIFVLEPQAGRISIFNKEIVFQQVIELNSLIPGLAAQSLTVHNDQLFVVDGGNNKVFPIDNHGIPQPPIELKGAEHLIQKITAVAFDNISNRIYLSDSKAKDIKVFKNFNFVHSISGFQTSNGTVNFFGPERLAIDSKGSLLVIDRIWKEGINAGATSGYLGEEWTWKLNISTSIDVFAEKIYKRNISNWHSKSDCISVHEDELTYCNSARYLVRSQVDGKNLTEIHPHKNPIYTVNEPRKISIDEDGNYFVVSSNHHLAAISSEQKFLYRKGGWGTAESQFLGISDMLVIGDKIYIASEKGEYIKVFNKNTFEYLFQFEVKDSNGQTAKPEKISHYDNQIFIKVKSDTYVVYNLKGQKTKNAHTVLDINGNATGLGVARDFSMDDSGLLYYLDLSGQRVFVINTQKDRIVKEITLNKFSNVIAPCSQRNLLFVSHENSVYYYSTDTGKPVGTFGVGGINPGTFNGITDIDLFKSHIYLTDFHNQRVQKISLKLFDKID